MKKSMLVSLMLIAVVFSVAPAYAVYPFEKANYWGYELEKIPGLTDQQECASRCDKNANCKVASVHGPGAPDGSANECVLRSAVGARHTEQADIMSWVKP